ncbi:DUF3164 family protein [Alkaliflexus imshenetskii]|uniref:DUF3164 family protein n=1 Tax=Alkaliflexus imshenetskii TaxID=286730 RepID=UPI00047CD6A8|nr:DUF3164 family protein [Alkaliflexus imshenetskii]
MIDVSTISPQERAKLMEQLQAQEQAEREHRRKERENYRDLVAKTVSENILKLQNISSLLSRAKADVFNSFTALLELKKDLYNYKDGQQSHAFTDDAGHTITIGCRVVDGWDDTVEAGISKVNSYIESLAKDEDTAKLVRIIQNLLKKDAKGNLKANRVLELQKMADDINDETFRDGVKIISEAYKPVRSAYFIEASVKDSIGKAQGVPLSITSVDFPEGENINTDAL